MTVNVKTGEEKTITPTSGVVAYVIDTLDNQPDDILISSNERNPQVFDVYRHNLKQAKILSSRKTRAMCAHGVPITMATFVSSPHQMVLIPPFYIAIRLKMNLNH